MKRYLVLIAIILFQFSCDKNKKHEAKEDVPVSNDLPTMQIQLTDGRTLDAKTLEGATILVMFQPDCDHCQREAEQIRENLKAFKAYSLYFVSSASMQEIEKFSKDYGLNEPENVFFGYTPVQSVLNNFGPIQAPSMYIYSKNGTLVQALNGEVDISVILKYL